MSAMMNERLEKLIRDGEGLTERQIFPYATEEDLRLAEWTGSGLTAIYP
jgi:hypothetical protein